MKRIVNIVVAIILMFILAIPAMAQGNEFLTLGRIAVTMPEIKVELKGNGFDKSLIEASLDSEKLAVVDAFKYDHAANSSCAYILVDLSGSMSGSFKLVKKNIVKYIESLGDNDKVVVITFGETEVNTVLNGSEDRATAINTVNALKCNENGTLFYEAINQAYQLSNSSLSGYDREYVIAFSDGIDVQKGSSTFDEVLKLYNSHSLPLYAACSYNTSKSASDKFGELARASGGEFQIIKNENEFADFLAKINDVTVVKLMAGNNYADGKEKQLRIKIGESMVEFNAPIIRSISDNEAPKISKLVYDINKDVFVIGFSEKVVGADKANSYKITDSNGNKVAVRDVFYSENDGVYEIKTSDLIKKGSYKFEFSGITDASQEANALSEKKTVNVEKAKNKESFPMWGIVAVAVGSICFIGIIALVVVLTTKKGDSEGSVANSQVPVKAPSSVMEYSGAASGSVKHHIMNDNSLRIRLWVKTGKMSEQNIETNILSSIIIGRSDTCDIYIDDTKLSRQHFVIEHDSGNLYVTDLQSRNGTMLNGIKIVNRQPLRSGDKIIAGLSEIIVTVLG